MIAAVVLEIDCRWSKERCDEQLPILSEEIQARAARYLSEVSRRNLIATRTRLREVLISLGLDPEQVCVAANGRPYFRDQALQFNLSHSQDRAALVVSRAGTLVEGLGVDLENVHRTIDVVAIGRRFFTADEHSWVGQDPTRFFRIWTRKEAVLKSNGVGLRVALDSFDVLSDHVADHVTGQELFLTTSVSDDYTISLAANTDSLVLEWVSDRDADWAERLVVNLG